MDFLAHIFLWLSDIDKTLLLVANGLHTELLDRLMWGITDRWIWIPFYALLAFFVFKKCRLLGGVMCLLFVILMITATDQTCATFLRPAIARMRPSNPENPLSLMLHYVNDYHGGRYGFPSCHAANTFALAVFLSLLFKNRYFTIMITSWSIIVSFSRIYLGVHYPSDILGGFLIGGLIAVLCYRIMVLSVQFFSKFRLLHG